jgi:WD40 repeat protein
VGSGANFTCAKFCPNRCNTLAAGDDQNNVIIWKLTETKPRRTMTGKSPCFTMIFNDSIKTLFTGTMSGMAYAWDIE